MTWSIDILKLFSMYFANWNWWYEHFSNIQTRRLAGNAPVFLPAHTHQYLRCEKLNKKLSSILLDTKLGHTDWRQASNIHKISSIRDDFAKTLTWKHQRQGFVIGIIWSPRPSLSMRCAFIPTLPRLGK